jgi:hypothetical protein
MRLSRVGRKLRHTCFPRVMASLVIVGLLLDPITRELLAHPPLPAKLGISFQIPTAPPMPNRAGYLERVSGTWSVQPAIPGATTNPLSLSGRLSFSLTTTAPATPTTTSSQLSLSGLSVTGAALQVTGLSTGAISMRLKGPARPIGRQARRLDSRRTSRRCLRRSLLRRPSTYPCVWRRH